MTDRRLTLAAFIRSQAGLTDTKPPVPGPGCVQLNNDEALLAAEALEQVAGDGVSLDDVIRGHVLRILEQCEGHKPTAAQLLGVSLKTLYNYLAKWRGQ